MHNTSGMSTNNGRYTFLKNEVDGLDDPAQYGAHEEFWVMYDERGSTNWTLYANKRTGGFGFYYGNSEPQFATLAETCAELAFAYEETNMHCAECRP